MNLELCHHGVKGQRWGQKNGPPYPLAPEAHSANEKKERWQYSLNKNMNTKSKLKKISDYSTEAGKLTLTKKKKSENASKASSKTTSPLEERIKSPFKKAGLMASNGIESRDIKASKLFTARPLGDEGIRITKGSIVQHVMSTPTKDMTNRDYLFVAATEADKKNYGGFFAALTKYRNNVDQMYKMEMTAKTDLVSPSKKERVNTFIEIYKNDPVKVATQLAEFNKRNYAGQYKESTEQLVKKYSNMSMRELKNMGYYTYANSWFDPQAGTLKDMRSKLESKGYNAIIDDNDKRSFVQSQAPLIVFNVMENLGDTKVSKLTNGEIRRNMIDWQNMKHSAIVLGKFKMDCILGDELYHHGVKGMKWGVRHDYEPTGNGRKRTSNDEQNKSKKQKNGKGKILTKRNVAIGAAVVGTALAVMGGVYLYKKNNPPWIGSAKYIKYGTEIDVSKLSSVDTIIPKGTKFQRMSTKSIEDYTEKGKVAYASYLKKDNRVYKEKMASMHGLNNMYVHHMKMKSDIKVPSEKTMAELYMKATGNTKVDHGRYNDFMTRLIDRNNPETQKFFEYARKAGYNAVTDLNDAGPLSKKPLILLDPGNDILTSKSHKLRFAESFVNVLLM